MKISQTRSLHFTLRSQPFFFAEVLFVATLAGCGGGGDSTVSSTTMPTVGVSQSFAVTDTDNSDNVIHTTVLQTTVSVAADGSYVQSLVGQGPDVAVNGTAYGSGDTLYDYDASGDLKGYSVPAGNLVCTYDAPKPPLPTSLPIGEAWPVIGSHLVCNNGRAYEETREDGSVVDFETITVPAGTFLAKKVQYTRVVQYLANSVVRTELHTNWYDTVSRQFLQSAVDNSFTGATFSVGYVVHEVRQLLPLT